MIVLGYNASGRVTISKNEFDGITPTSATCNGMHYWTLLFYGSGDLITFAQNYVHNTSGRGPKVDGNSNIHVFNNLWENVDGHAFDISKNDGKILIEGNVFRNVKYSELPGN